MSGQFGQPRRNVGPHAQQLHERLTREFQQFDLVRAITGSNDAATQTLSALLYEEIFGGFRVGRGAAYACVVLVLVIALASVFTRYLDSLRRRGGGEAP